MNSLRPSLSVIAPVFNECGNLEPLVSEVYEVLKDYSSEWELILIDDGSTDQTSQELEGLLKKHSTFFRVISLKKNFGQTAAMSAGIDAAKGDVIVTLDADLQNDPRDIPRLLEKMAEGYDVVSGWRKERKDHFISRTLPSHLANSFISCITGVSLHDFGCSLKAYDRETIQSFRLYGEMHRFLPALCTWRGGKVAEIVVNHRPRIRGVSKYGIARTFRVILDLLTVKFLLEYSTKPMRIFGTWGLLFGITGFGIGAYLSCLKFLFHQDIGHRPLLFLGGILVIVGIQLVMLGLLSELLVRIYYESQGKMVYQIARPRRGKNVQE